jgi:hypothetical protein
MDTWSHLALLESAVGLGNQKRKTGARSQPSFADTEITENPVEESIVGLNAQDALQGFPGLSHFIADELAKPLIVEQGQGMLKVLGGLVEALLLAQVGNHLSRG